MGGRLSVEHRAVVEGVEVREVVRTGRSQGGRELAAEAAVAKERADLGVARSAWETIVLPEEERPERPGAIVEGVGVLHERGIAGRLAEATGRSSGAVAWWRGHRPDQGGRAAWQAEGVVTRVFGRFREEGGGVGDRGAGDVALGMGEAGAANHGEVLGGLHAFGGDGHALGACERDDGADQLGGGGLPRSWTKALSSLMRWCGRRAR